MSHWTGRSSLGQLAGSFRGYSKLTGTGFISSWGPGQLKAAALILCWDSLQFKATAFNFLLRLQQVNSDRFYLVLGPWPVETCCFDLMLQLLQVESGRFYIVVTAAVAAVAVAVAAVILLIFASVGGCFLRSLLLIVMSTPFYSGWLMPESASTTLP